MSKDRKKASDVFKETNMFRIPEKYKDTLLNVTKKETFRSNLISGTRVYRLEKIICDEIKEMYYSAVEEAQKK